MYVDVDVDVLTVRANIQVKFKVYSYRKTWYSTTSSTSTLNHADGFQSFRLK